MKIPFVQFSILLREKEAKILPIYFKKKKILFMHNNVIANVLLYYKFVDAQHCNFYNI